MTEENDELRFELRRVTCMYKIDMHTRAAKHRIQACTSIFYTHTILFDKYQFLTSLAHVVEQEATRDELRRLQQLSGDLKQHNGTLANDLKLLRVQSKELTEENHSLVLMNARLQQTVSDCLCVCAC